MAMLNNQMFFWEKHVPGNYCSCYNVLKPMSVSPKKIAPTEAPVLHICSYLQPGIGDVDLPWGCGTPHQVARRWLGPGGNTTDFELGISP